MIPLSLPYNKSCEISGSAIHNRYIVHWHSSCIRSTLIWFTRKNGTLRELARESKEKREGETTRETLQEKRKREREKRGEEKKTGRRKGARRISSKDETGSTVSVNGSGVYINQAAARVLAAKEFASRSIERRAEKRSRERERERERSLSAPLSIREKNVQTFRETFLERDRECFEIGRSTILARRRRGLIVYDCFAALLRVRETRPPVWLFFLVENGSTFYAA